MTLTTAQLLDLNDRIAHTLERHIEPLFKRGTKVTLLARTPGNDEADVLVSSEGDLQDALDMVVRSMSRNAIGGPAVDHVPRLASPAVQEAPPRDERAEFEALMRKELSFDEHWLLTNNGQYVSLSIAGYWKVWQARAALPAAQPDAALVADAARYRWLRAQKLGEDGEFLTGLCVDRWEDGGGTEISGDALDAAIDAAMDEHAERQGETS